jgi:hypothetical protein
MDARGKDDGPFDARAPGREVERLEVGPVF